MKEAKTNAMRILDKDTISYKTYSYELQLPIRLAKIRKQCSKH